jgi:CMP-N-acetylneuraminic acid synthetase
MNILAIIPARAGSKRVPKKNIKELLGKPLINYTIDAAKESKTISRIVVSTDDNEVKAIVANQDIDVIDRPKELATDESTTADVLLHAIEFLEKEKYYPDIVVLLQATSPLRTSQDIDESVNVVLSGQADSTQTVASVKEHPSLMVYLDEQNNIAPYDLENHLKRSQEFKKLFIKTGAVFVFKTVVLKKTHDIYGDKHLAVIIPHERSLDIDEPEDFSLAEMYLQKK